MKKRFVFRLTAALIAAVMVFALLPDRRSNAAERRKAVTGNMRSKEERQLSPSITVIKKL